MLDISLTADLGRAESDSTRLAGLGDIDAGVALKLKASHEHGAFSYSASVERSLADDEGGFRIDLEAGCTRVFGGTLALTPALVARYGSADYGDRMFPPRHALRWRSTRRRRHRVSRRRHGLQLCRRPSSTGRRAASRDTASASGRGRGSRWRTSSPGPLR